MPAINILFFEKIMEYTLRGNYTYDIAAKLNRISASNELTARPGYGWTLAFSNTLGYQATTDKETDEKYKYSNMYFEFRVRKEFGFNQPRFKYLTANVSFFKDLNGNGIRESDEPGVENVLVSIDKDYQMADSILGSDRRGEFYAMEFLSDLNGVVTYKNIPDGFYNIRFTPMGKNAGNFVTEYSNLRIHLDKSQTIEIPFQEKNKIFGQILMNRSKLSNLGTIDISNIKVTATDTKGKMYSTLTDKNGKFVIYVPNVEKYTVSINNIFREHFELEQNSFDVQLNGYKQFELTYIFTEKQRRINFAQQVSFDAQSQQVQVVRRTNLGGTVKDGTTFAPIKALVRIVDAPTGNVVSETVSDGRTGTFYVSFVSGQNYRLDVTADDYWFYSEQLVGEQLSTFMNLNRDITLTAITVGSKLTLRNVTFERNEATLNEEARVELKRMLDVLNANPGIQIQIVGHCDDVEAIDRVVIAEDRAKAVMKFLVENGYTNVTHSTSGGMDPVANEASEEARKLNRRVEAIVISK
jgi:outer membrane protein OmpA-like peptidoglycan-associated protein